MIKQDSKAGQEMACCIFFTVHRNNEEKKIVPYLLAS